MKKIIDLITDKMTAAFEMAGYEPSYGRVSLSNRPDLCEYQCNGAMAAAKAYKKAPIMIAQDVVAQLEECEAFASVEAVKPGFINLRLAGEYLAGYLNEMGASEKLGTETAESPMRMILDYGGPNVAKPLHVGHLRSAIIGESIKRMGRYLSRRPSGLRKTR
mgnify:CR=1 FL=1